MENRVNKNGIAESAVCKGIVIGTDDAEGYGDAMGSYIVAYSDCDGLV